MMAALRHPNIVAFLGVCADPPAVVTEYCRRGSLTGECQGAMPVYQAWATAMCNRGEPHQLHQAQAVSSPMSARPQAVSGSFAAARC